MAGGLLALLDDVATIAKLAAASVDDVIGQATKAGAKAAGAVIDDAAVTPKYMDSIHPARELPMVWRIARGSAFNKIVILLPAALLLLAFAPWAISPILMLGGLYLCFEGAEKVWHRWHAAPIDQADTPKPAVDAAHLEEKNVRGAIRTDFILSAEIMTIALAALDPASIWFSAVALSVVALAITVLVYGSVALIVKADDVGLYMARRGRVAATRAVGRAIVRGMPAFLRVLVVVGTAAMLWVGAAILTHALGQLGLHGPEDTVHAIAQAAASLGTWAQWLAGALVHAGLGLALGTGLIVLLRPIKRIIAAR